jgi:hypothetical protein
MMLCDKDRNFLWVSAILSTYLFDERMVRVPHSIFSVNPKKRKVLDHHIYILLREISASTYPLSLQSFRRLALQGFPRLTLSRQGEPPGYAGSVKL